VDVNGDGKVNADDLTLIQSQTTVPAKAAVNSFKVIAQDLTIPSITVKQADNSTAENPIFTGHITDASGIKSAAYQRDGGAWIPLTLDAQGNYSIQNKGLAAGTHTLLLKVTDTKGNTATSEPFEFTVIVPTAPTAPALTLNTTEKESITAAVKPTGTGTAFTINGLTLVEGTLPNALRVADVASISAAGKFVFTPKEYFTHLAEGETRNLTFRYTITDTLYGLTGTGLIHLAVAGQNNAPEFQLEGSDWNIAGNAAEQIIDLSGFVSDDDAGTGLFISQFNGVAAVKNVPVMLPSGASLTYIGGLKVLYETNGKFKTLPQGTAAAENITLSVSDGKAEHSETLTLTVAGTHTPPQLLSPSTVTLPPQNINDLADGFIGDSINIKKDADNSLTYSVSCVDSHGKIYQNLFRYENGLFINPGEFDSLNRNETYTVSVKIENAESDYGDKPLTVVYTLNFISRGEPTAAGNTLTLSEDDTAASVDLAAADTVDGQSLRGHSGYTYSVVPVSNSTEITLTAETDYSIVDGVFTFKPNGKFSALSASEKATLTFRYKITDTEQGSGIYNTEGILTVFVNGKNDAPELTASRNTFHTTNSNAAANAVISAGVSFSVTDPDHNDKPVLSVGTVSGTKNGLTLTKIPAFALDSAGRLSFTNKDIPELLPGESAVFTVEITATDIAGATDSKTVNVVLHAKKLPVVSGLTNRNIVESDDAISERFAVSVSDAPELFLTKRTGNAWYNIPSISVNIPKEYQELFPDLSQHFTVQGNETDGYAVAFDVPAGYFDALHKDETFGITVQLTVADKGFNAAATETFPLSISGTGDAHTVQTAIDSFDYWANKRTKETAVFDPQYTITDKDRNENHVFTLQNAAVDKLPAGFTQEQLVSLLTLQTNGTVVLNTEELDGITESFAYQASVRISSPSDGYYVDVPLTLHMKYAAAPVIDDIEIVTEENTVAQQTLVPQVPSDGAEREKNWYSVSEPKYSGYYGTIPAGFDAVAVARAAASFNGNTFVFQPGTYFDFLPAGTSMKLFYAYTVRDNRFAVETTKTISVTVNGTDDAPVLPAVQNFTVNISGKKDTDSVIIGNFLFSDADTPLDQYKFTITDDETGEFHLSRTDPTQMYLTYYSDLFLPGKTYRFKITAALKSNPSAAFQSEITVAAT
ncbi:MAG: Ig-like domain-containing protein, partial [Planctomycetaceae bacterium]|nr:Ig-like domain-containing protein [Planctomycetaceae bacterium]